MTVEISTKQAKDFAYSIFSDIACYINEHQAEYEEFIRNEELHNE